MLIRLSSN